MIKIPKKKTKPNSKRAVKKIKPDILKDVPVDNRFFVCNGDILNNLEELSVALKYMDDNVYDFHANAEKNDFANWIESTIGDKRLGTAVRKSKDKIDMAKKIKAKIKRAGK